jgi:hypothetical protein
MICCGKKRTLSIFLVVLPALVLRARVEQDVMAPFRIRVSSAAHSILSPQYHSCPCELLSSLALEWLVLGGFNINAPLATTDGFISPLFRSPHSIKSLIFRKQFYPSISTSDSF